MYSYWRKIEQMYGFAPSRRCSSTVARPPVKAFITFFRARVSVSVVKMLDSGIEADILPPGPRRQDVGLDPGVQDRKSTRLNSSHVRISYAVFCLKKKKH